MVIRFFFSKIVNNTNINKKKKHFYVCSYGGCGSTLLFNYLKNYGCVEHVHSRNPPKKLTKIGEHVYSEWFNDIQVPSNELDQYYIIYIYRDPIHAIHSRFRNMHHLDHIQCKNRYITISDILNTGQDLYGIEEFFDNYTRPNQDRNYKIICVKYEELFNRYPELLKILDINEFVPFPKERVSPHRYINEPLMRSIYSNLQKKMNSMDFITIL